MKKLIASTVGFVFSFTTPTFAYITDGLVAWWSFDATNAVDNSGNGHNGIVHGATPVAGAKGSAFSFNGSGNWIEFGRSGAFDLTNNLTIGAWVNYNSIAGGFGSQILWYGDTTPAHDPWELHLLPGGTAQFRLDVGTGGLEVGLNSSSALAPGQWYFLVGTLTTVSNSLKTLMLYVNGVLDGTLVTNASVNYDLSAMKPEIGAVDNGTWQFFNGKIDEPFVYNRALSAAEIHQIYVYGIPEPQTVVLVLVGLTALGLRVKKHRTH